MRDLGPVTLLNGGTIGGGGAGNFHENQPFGLAVLTYDTSPRSNRSPSTWCGSTRATAPRAPSGGS